MTETAEWTEADEAQARKIASDTHLARYPGWRMAWQAVGIPLCYFQVVANLTRAQEDVDCPACRVLMAQEVEEALDPTPELCELCLQGVTIPSECPSCRYTHD